MIRSHLHTNNPFIFHILKMVDAFQYDTLQVFVAWSIHWHETSTCFFSCSPLHRSFDAKPSQSFIDMSLLILHKFAIFAILSHTSSCIIIKNYIDFNSISSSLIFVSILIDIDVCSMLLCSTQEFQYETKLLSIVDAIVIDS